jgi:hypothetical protein
MSKFYYSNFYHRKYRYKTLSEYKDYFAALSGVSFVHRYVSCTNGILKIEENYAWDGATGVIFDSYYLMKASLIHDALYQMMREGLLDRKKYRKVADKIFYSVMKDSKVNPIRRRLLYIGVRLFGKKYTKSIKIL